MKYLLEIKNVNERSFYRVYPCNIDNYYSQYLDPSKFTLYYAKYILKYDKIINKQINKIKIVPYE